MHTPGPWSAGRAIPEDNTISRIVRAGDDHIAAVMDLDGAAQEAADNARMIAPAPELLAACLEVAQGYTTRGSEMARAAIAKATGEQS